MLEHRNDELFSKQCLQLTKDQWVKTSIDLQLSSHSYIVCFVVIGPASYYYHSLQNDVAQGFKISRTRGDVHDCHSNFSRSEM